MVPDTALRRSFAPVASGDLPAIACAAETVRGPRPPGSRRGMRERSPTMMRGEGTEVIDGVTPEEVFHFVLDDTQYSKADTKIVRITKVSDTDDGMIAIEEGKFFGLPGSVVTRYRWVPFKSIEVTLVHGMLKSLNASFEIEQTEGGTRVHHVEEMEMALGPLGPLFDVTFAKWLRDSVRKEVTEIKRLMESGERGRPFPGLRAS
jgi:ribosome-associated toxin RatA of RatAB toxin-antitoxin module